jgi:DNA-binding transcriptional regulator YdaS (Cro superfamily)
MANENLKIALARAGLTAEQFAEIISVDPKTVQRWISGRTPYARHRATIARALDLTEHALLPDDVPPPAAPDRAAGDRQSGSEVTGTWAYDTDPGAPDPIRFVSDAGDRIDVLDSYGELLHTPGLTAALLKRGADGCQIRGLMDEPSHHVRALIGHDHIELRVSGGSNPIALLRSGDTMLLRIVLNSEEDQPAPSYS